MSEELKDLLRAQAVEIAEEGHLGWGNTMVCAASALDERDARIVELESDLAGTQLRVLTLQDQWRKLDGELSAIKAQEPVARLPACPSRAFAVANLRDLAQSVLQHDPDVGIFRDADQAYLINELADLAEAFNGDVKLYAAPVSEAKEQGVERVQWQVRYLKAETVSDGWWQDSSGQRAEWCAEVNQQHAKGLPDTWEIRRFTIAAPVQQVSVPDGWKLVPVDPTHEMLGAALMNQVECLDAIAVIRTDYRAMLAAAPAAPAADADPCPKCIPGTVCRTPKCGRLKAQQHQPIGIDSEGGSHD